MSDTRHLARHELHLLAAARKFNSRLQVTTVGADLALDPTDARHLLTQLNPVRSSVDSELARRLLTLTVPLTPAQVTQLSTALDRVAVAVDRAGRIRRGQIPGALSASEAVTVMRMMGRL